MWIVLFCIVIAVWAVWVAYTVTQAGGYPPYQDNMNKCNKDCNQGRNCDCYQRSCDMTVAEYDNKTWPFPKEKP